MATVGATRVRFAVVITAAWLMMLLLLAAPALAQAQAPAGVNPMLPTIPSREARQTDGDWGLKKEQAALPTFIESIKGNDAAIEVAVGEGRLLTTKHPVNANGGSRFIAVGDPSIVDFEVLPNPQMIRLIGRRPGVTDLSITTADDQTYSFEIRVVYSLDLLRAQLRQLYPDADMKLAQIGANIVVEGQARSTAQVSNIVQTIQGYIDVLHGAPGS